MRLALAVAALVAATAAWAEPIACRLSTAECIRVGRELVGQAEDDARDAAEKGRMHGLTAKMREDFALEDGMKMLEERASKLPKRIGDEVERIWLCRKAPSRELCSVELW